MGVLAGLDHLANFLAPALFLALALAAVGWLAWGRAQPGRRAWRHAAVNFAVGAAALAAGLAVFGRDGKMATYAALVVAVAASQWCLSGGWRRR
jgi:hypothetical protein